MPGKVLSGEKPLWAYMEQVLVERPRAAAWGGSYRRHPAPTGKCDPEGRDFVEEALQDLVQKPRVAWYAPVPGKGLSM